MNKNTNNLILLLLLASCWGPSFLFIKVAVQEIDPIMLAALRIGSGALLLNVFLLIKGQLLSAKWDFWKKTLFAGFFAQGLPFVLINWGEQYVDSSLASLLNGMVPVFTILLAQVALNERLTPNKIWGVTMGLLGLIILVWPDLGHGVAATRLGILAIAGATISYGIGLVYIRKHLTHVPSVHAPAAQLLTVSIYLVPLAFFVNPTFDFTQVSWKAWGSLGVLGVFGTAIAFILYFKVIERTSASYASMVTFLMPIYGVVLGIIFLNEQLTLWMVWGAILILGGICLVNRSPAESKTRRFGERLDFRIYTKFR